MLSWAKEAAAALEQGPTALVTILATEGSAPRGVGVRMVVTGEQAFGTIGGGALEFQAINQARAALEGPAGAWRVQDYPLGPLLGQCCGGRVRLLVERLVHDDRAWLNDVAQGALLTSTFEAERVARRVSQEVVASTPVAARGSAPSTGDRLEERLGGYRRPVLLFGAGHVGRAIARAAEGLPLSIAWFDSRPECAQTPGVIHAEPLDLAACAETAMPDAAVLILTHDHGLDYALTGSALQSQAAFIGLIGSATKRARFFSRLRKDGVGEEMLSRLTCPIGLPEIIGKEPAVIALSALAQLLALLEPERP